MSMAIFHSYFELTEGITYGSLGMDSCLAIETRLYQNLPVNNMDLKSRVDDKFPLNEDRHEKGMVESGAHLMFCVGFKTHPIIDISV